MATSGNSRDVRMTLSVETLGEDDIKRLQAALTALAKEGGDAAPEFQRLADEIDRIGQQAAALRAFQELSNETAALAARQEATAASATELRAELDAVAAVAQQAAERQRLISEALQSSRAAYQASDNELKRLRATTDAAGRSDDQYIARRRELTLAMLDQREESQRLSAELRTANGELRAAEQAQARTAKAYDQAATAAQAASDALQRNNTAIQQAEQTALELGVTTENIAESQAQLVVALNQTGQAAQTLQGRIARLAEQERELEGIRAFQAQVDAADRLMQTAEYTRLFDQALQQLAETERAREAANTAAQWQRDADALVEATHAAQEMARQTAILAEAQRELAAQRAFQQQADDAARLQQAASYVRFWTQALDEAEAQARRTADEARLSAERINNAFGSLGIRSAEALQAEIVEVRAAMQTVATTAGVTGGQIRAAFDAGNTRIRELERELRSVSGQLTLADQAAGLFKNSLGQIAAGNIIADGIGYLVNKVKEMGAAFVTTIVQTEQLRRGLNAVYRDSRIAGEQFDFLRRTANDAGVSVSDIQQAFVRFSAATRASGINLETTNALFTEITRSAAALGLNGEAVTGMLEALAQTASKGTVSMEELRQQLGDRLPGALTLVAQGLGLTDAQLIKLVESGGLAARDLFPALTQSLQSMRGASDGLRPSWERLRNVLAETAQNAGDAGWTQLLTAGLRALTAAAAAVLLPLSAFFELVFTGARALGILAGSIVTLTNPMEELSRVAGEAAERQARLTKSFGDAITGAQGAATAAEKHQQAMEQQGAAAAEAATALTSTAKAQEAQAFAAQLAANSNLDLSSRLVQLKAYIDQLLASQTKQIEAAGKLAKAAEIEGDSLVRLAQLRGQDYAALEAEVTAAERNVAALNNLAEAHRTETELLTLKRDEIVRTALAQDGNTRARQVEIDAINQKIVASQAETEQATQAAAAAQQEAAIRQASVQTYRDNAAAVDQFRAAMDNANRTLEAYEQQLAQGNATEAQVAAARQQAAIATNLYNDAVRDSIALIDLEARAKEANANVTRTKLDIEQRAYASLAQVARATGDFTQALYYEIEARRRQIESIRVTSEAKRIEAQATIDALEVERQALDVNDPLLAQKRAELDIRLANAKAKLLEANAGRDLIASLEREITMLRVNAETRARGRSEVDADTNSRNRNADSIERQTQALDRQNKTSDGFKANADGSAAGSFNNSLPVDQAFAIVDKLNAGTLTANDLDAAKAAFEQAQNAMTWLESINQASVSMQARTTAEGTLRATQRALETVRGLAAAEEKAKAQGSGSAAPAGPAAPTGPAQPRGTTVIINIGGRTTAVNVASQQDANALTGLLRQLETASGASA